MIRNHYKLLTIRFYLGKPVVYISRSKYSIRKGESVVLQCNMYGKTNPVITFVRWFKQDGTTENNLANSTQKYSGGNLQNPALTILNAAYSDTGIYKCKAYNSKGQSYATTELIVWGKLNWRA